MGDAHVADSSGAGGRGAGAGPAIMDGGMLGKPFGSANVVFVPTASVAEPGDHGWVVTDMSRLHGLGWREFDVLELNGLPRQMVLDRLFHADVIYVEGGSHYHLARSITGIHVHIAYSSHMCPK